MTYRRVFKKLLYLGIFLLWLVSSLVCSLSITLGLKIAITESDRLGVPKRIPGEGGSKQDMALTPITAISLLTACATGGLAIASLFRSASRPAACLLAVIVTLAAVYISVPISVSLGLPVILEEFERDLLPSLEP